MLKKLCVLAACFAFYSCNNSHILHHREDVSRTRICLDFSRNSKPFEVKSIVGGEHMTFYTVLGFEADRFSVTLTPLDGTVFCGVSGEGISVTGNESKGVIKKSIRVIAPEALFSIGLSAHPYGEYLLRIEKTPSAAN